MRTLTALSLILPIILQACILGLMAWRKLLARLPCFSIYTAYVLLEAIFRLAGSGNEVWYFRVYWLAELGDVVLMLVAIGESFWSVFWLETKLRWFNVVFWSCLGIALAYACARAWLLPPHQAGRVMTVLLNVEFAVAVVISAFGLLYGAGVRLFGMIGHQRETGIIFGFGINATLLVFACLARSTFGTKVRFVSDWIPAVSYLLAESIWVWTMARREQKIPDLDDETLVELNQALGHYVTLVNTYLGREAR